MKFGVQNKTNASPATTEFGNLEKEFRKRGEALIWVLNQVMNITFARLMLQFFVHMHMCIFLGEDPPAFIDSQGEKVKKVQSLSAFRLYQITVA